jgi:hypothetical protein
VVDFKALRAPFDPQEIYWRLGQVSAAKRRGLALAYIDARVVMDRLDEVCGPDGWQCKYSHANGKTVCDIAVRAGDEWVWKADGAGDSDIEAEKGALSDAFKRCAVRWGIGRYLYHIKSPWVEVHEAGKKRNGDPIWEITDGAYRELDMIVRRASQAILNPTPKEPSFISLARDDIAQMQNSGDVPITELKSAGRQAAEKYVSDALKLFADFNGVSLAEWYRTPVSPKGKVTNRDKVTELSEKHPDLHEKIESASEEVRLRRAA